MNFKRWALLVLLTTPALAAEVDQFTHSPLNLSDSAPAVNRYMNQYLQETLGRLERRNKGCDANALYDEALHYFNNHGNGKIIGTLNNDAAIQKDRTKIKDSIYRDWNFFDGFFLGGPGMENSEMAMSAVIRLDDHYIGIDKFEHLFDRGFSYFSKWKSGTYIDDVLVNGAFWEKNLYGGQRWGTGVFSYGDLAANFNGLRFWNDLLAERRDVLGRDLGPYVVCRDGKFIQSKPIDILNYLDAAANETVNCSTFVGQSELAKVERQLKALGRSCPLDQRALPQLMEKYGPYAPFVLNTEGMRVSQSHKKWKRERGVQQGRRQVPRSLLRWVRPAVGSLTYDAGQHFLRDFQIPSSDQRSHGVSFLNWYDLELAKETPAESRACWMQIISGGQCGLEVPAPRPDAYTPKGTLDLLTYIRDVSYHNGLAVARDVLATELAKRDASRGEIRERLVTTTFDTNYVYPDSFANIPRELRARIGVYLILGIGGERSANAALIKAAAEQIAGQGFQAEMLPVDANLGSEYNARLLKDLLQERVPKLDKVVLVAASKGASDFITFFLQHGASFEAQDREKFKLITTLSGVIRPSIVAQYLSQSSGATALFVRNGLKVSGRGSILDGIKSLARDPWAGYAPGRVKELFPNLRWLSMPSLPEGEDGVTHLSLWEGFLKTPTYRWGRMASPMDGLVESAASVLPPDTGIEESIVPIYGPHAMALGSYAPGLLIAPKTMQGVRDKVLPEAGTEILSAVFRALPMSMLED